MANLVAVCGICVSSNRHERCLIHTVRGYERAEGFRNRPVVFNKCGNTAKRTIYHALVILPNLVEHHVESVLNVGDLSRNGLALLVHKPTEHTALVGQVFNYFLNFGEADLTFFDKVFHLVLSNTELLCKLSNQRNTTTDKLIEVLRVQASLRHCRAVEIHQITERNRKSGCNVAQPYQCLVHLVGFKTISEQLLRSARYLHEVERGCGSGLHHLSHEGIGFRLGLQHCLHCHLQFLKLATHSCDLGCKLFQRVCGTEFGKCTVNAANGIVHACAIGFYIIRQLLKCTLRICYLLF